MSLYDAILLEGKEKGREERIEEGIEKGIEQGIEKGIEKVKIATVINCFIHSVSISLTANIFGMTEEEVIGILRKNNLIK